MTTDEKPRDAFDLLSEEVLKHLLLSGPKMLEASLSGVLRGCYELGRAQAEASLQGAPVAPEELLQRLELMLGLVEKDRC